ncbi:hypothetical protein DFH28DRAFT_1093672 [Melampsora americana]|nr:hypothetical protein DFH28DRAFT_1093672 [Melampsora americana]
MIKFRFPNSKKSQTTHQEHSSQSQSQSQSDQLIEREEDEKDIKHSTESSLPSTSANTTTHHHQIQINSSSPSTSYSESNLNHLHSSHPNLNQSYQSHSSPLTHPHHHPEDQSSSNPHSIHQSNPSLMFPKKTRRKSYGGIRAMLGINQKPEENPPPLPVPIPSSSDSSQPQAPLASQVSIDTSTSPASSLISIPPSPITAESRPSTSSLRPFPFLGGMRRKSANSNAPKPNPHHLPWSSTAASSSIHPTPHLPNPNISPTTSNSNLKSTPIHNHHHPSSLGNRIYSHGSSKKAQSVDDLSQFGLLPKPRIKSRRSVEEFNRINQLQTSSSLLKTDDHHHPLLSSSSAEKNPTDELSKGLDQIGELAGSLASITHEDRHPRLSNPKEMRTVYGVSLKDLFWRDGDQYPLLVNILVELIEEKGIDQQGIYRVPGEKRVIENLQASIDERGVTGVDIWKESYKDVHNLSGLLKLFLREIPGGVIPFDRYDTFLAVSGIEESLKTSQLHAHVKELPKPNRILLLRLVRHFEKVVAHAETNSMLAHNVAIVFAPSLFRSGSEHSNPLLSMQNIGKASAIVRHLVLNVNEIFESSEKEEEEEKARERVRIRREKDEGKRREEEKSEKKTQQQKKNEGNSNQSWNIRNESNKEKKKSSRSSKTIKSVSNSIPNSNQSSSSTSSHQPSTSHKKLGRQSLQNQYSTTINKKKS